MTLGGEDRHAVLQVQEMHQDAQAFASALREALSDNDKILLSARPLDINAIRDCASRLSEVLLRYCSYNLAPPNAERPDPFDDPYVGAALITSSGEVLGAHRKVTRNEPHAEVCALVRAIRSTGNSELADEIEQRLSDKIWLNGERDKSAFIDLFCTAGNHLRSHLARHLQKERLILLSSLEPCRDFESQPSCSRLISAFKPDLVIYACDDTNTKGQGRSVLEEHEIPLLPNANPERNVLANLLFYSAVHYLRRLHLEALESHSKFETRYVIGHLDRMVPRLVMSDGRIRIHFDHSSCLPVHRVPHEIRAPSTIPNLGAASADPKRVLFINAIAPEFLLLYFQRHQALLGTTPGVLVCPRGAPIHDGGASNNKVESILKVLRESGTRIYENVLRKSDEEFLASQSLLRFEQYVAPPSVYVFVKEDGDRYSSFDTDIDSLPGKLLALKEPRRISIYLTRSSVERFAHMLREIRNSLAQAPRTSLARCSFRLFVASKDIADANFGKCALDEQLQRQTLSHRFTADVALLTPPSPSGSQELHDVAYGRLDLITVEIESLERMCGSELWKDRQKAGIILALAARQDPTLYAELIAERIPLAFNMADWPNVTSRLNAISKFGAPQNDVDHACIRDRLVSFVKGLEPSLSLKPAPAQLEDIAWRYLPAAFAVGAKYGEYSLFFRSHILRQFIGARPFLLKELFLYSCRATRARDEALRVPLAILKEWNRQLSEPQCIDIARRLARLASLQSSEIRNLLSSEVEEIFGEQGNVRAAFHKERSVCDTILSRRLWSLWETSDRAVEHFPSYLFLRTASQSEEHGGLTSVVIQTLDDASQSRSTGKGLTSWRGDKTVLARMTLSEVQPSQRMKFLQSMANDEDVSIQWAALVVAFDHMFRTELFGERLGKRAALQIRRNLGAVINRLVDVDAHYWLKREFAYLFEREHAASSELPILSRIQAWDVPSARHLFIGPTKELHPEVVGAITSMRRRQKRVLLILPSLSRVEQTKRTLSSSTPPLGLGSIASHLQSHGHYVEMVDLHRFGDYTARLCEKAKDFDFVGVGVVTSTFSSTKDLVAFLRNQLRDKCPVIVLGGHAVTLHTNDFLQHRSFHWDYLVVGDGEQAMQELVSKHPAIDETTISGVIPHRHRHTAKRSQSLVSTLQWDQMSWVNHAMFESPDGRSYEPAVTRNGLFREAHVVMSRGCSWKCSFCTEAVLRGKIGEVRRSVADVFEEVSYLVEESAVTRIQFVDDNFLPQLAAPHANQESCVNWAREFLFGLKGIASAHPNFAWRGIMRLEDFAEFQRSITDWYELLKDSGCMLLAFGIERGSEERRRVQKGGTISNSAISGIVKELRSRGIGSKAYFMIGGANETDSSAQETIDFAVSGGFTLAYFALYKEFRTIVKLSRASDGDLESREEQYMRFARLEPTFERDISNLNDPAEASRRFGRTLTKERIEEAREAVTRLGELGFSFGDLFKYDDYHEMGSGSVIQSSVWSNEEHANAADSFLGAVRRAYLEFYARRSFVTTYKWLLERGY